METSKKVAALVVAASSFVGMASAAHATEADTRGGGNDVIYGGDSGDRVGGGNDVIDGGDSGDRAGGGNDVIYGGDSGDRVGGGNDVIIGTGDVVGG